MLGAAGWLPAASGTAVSLPLVGANYAHVSLDGCDFDGHGIVAGGVFPRRLVQQQLAAMRAAGLQSLRLIVWNMHDATGQHWGVVSSAGGRLGPVEQRNLVDYLAEVRAAGFKQLTVAFAPEWTNDPIGYPDNRYDPSLFDENWHFIESVRGIVKRFGPQVTHFDLLNEGAPSDYLATKAQLEDYLGHTYANYVDAFGSGDVTVSSIVAVDDQTRIANLIDTLRATNRPLPGWFEIHLYSDTVLGDLNATDATLTAKGVTQPLTVGETYYDDADAAAALKTFVALSPRPVKEVIEWPIARGSSCSGVSPPYKADEFFDALTGSTPSTALTANVGPRSVSLRTPYGDPVTALEAGPYTVTVDNRTRRDRLTLAGPGVTVSTSPGAVTTHWSVVLAPGAYSYWAGSGASLRAGTFRVLPAG